MTRHARRRPMGGMLFLAFLCLLAVGYFAVGNVFRVKSVVVSGNYTRDAQAIAALSGLGAGDSVFRVSEDDVRRSIESDPYLELTAFNVKYPDSVELVVNERKAVAAVSCGGVYLVIDEGANVLEKRTEKPDMLIVAGAQITGGGTPGTKLACVESDQVDNILCVLTAMRARDAFELASELNVSDRFNLYLTTKNGVKALLGEADDMENKLIWLRAGLNELAARGLTGGLLDLTSGKDAVYKGNSD